MQGRRLKHQNTTFPTPTFCTEKVQKVILFVLAQKVGAEAEVCYVCIASPSEGAGGWGDRGVRCLRAAQTRTRKPGAVHYSTKPTEGRLVYYAAKTQVFGGFCPKNTLKVCIYIPFFTANWRQFTEISEWPGVFLKKWCRICIIT